MVGIMMAIILLLCSVVLQMAISFLAFEQCQMKNTWMHPNILNYLKRSFVLCMCAFAYHVIHSTIHFHAIDEYGKEIECVTFVVADNCATNKSIATLLEIKFIGCASHRMNLASKLLLEDVEPALLKIQKTMKMLGYLKRAAALRKHTHLGPVTRNVTRWTTDFAMVRRYADLKDIIEKQELTIPVELLINPVEWQNLVSVSANFVILEDITKGLQADNLNMFEARAMVDTVIRLIPDLAVKLSQNAHIVKDPEFESGIVKIITEQTDAMNEEEKKSCEIFLNPQQAPYVPSTSSGSFSQDAVKQAKAMLENKRKYIDLKFVAPTTNKVERLFSLCGLILTDNRSNMHTDTFEMVMMLKANRSVWDVNTVQNVINEHET